jgi:UDP-N-acetylmuramate dehydrogenase
MSWEKRFKGSIKRREALKDKTTFKIGGKAEFFVEPQDLADLRLLLAAARVKKLPVLLIGAGSNILVSGAGISAIVVKLSRPFFKRIFLRGRLIEAGSGASLSSLINFARKHGLSGLEFLSGIPGTLGGALAMNAGAWGRDIKELLEEAVVMDGRAREIVLKKDDINSGYRRSSLSKYIILKATLRLAPKDKKEISAKINAYLKRRRESQDTSLPNAGCVFRNPSKGSAGRLIDLCGLKGKGLGGAVVSRKHANFILNQNAASFNDVLRLMALIKNKVRNKFKLILQPEIKIWKD